MAKYSVHQQLVETLLTWIKSGEIAIPEIQRPFVWNATRVRDLIDSLYKGFPVGYIITWRNPDVKLKNGSLSAGRKVLIDGQQRITALTAAIVGQRVLNNNYKEIYIRIAFNPLEEMLDVLNKAYENSSEWINNINPARDDVKSFRNNNRWLAHHPQESLIFSEPDTVWVELSEVYQGEFKNLVYGRLPAAEAVLNTLKMISERLTTIKWTIEIDANV